LLPIYGLDQLAFFVAGAMPFILLATVNPRLALFLAVGAYVGATLTMRRSTPSSLLLPSGEERRVIDLLDRSRFLHRTGNGNEWMSNRGRLRRWDTDTIRVQRTPAGTLLTGRLIDLQTVAHQLSD
jgi:hypothetical protein